MMQQEREDTPVDENQESIDILESLQDHPWYSLDPKDKTKVRLYYGKENGYLAASRCFPVESFLKAVDWYQENRDAEPYVILAMTKPDGVVNIWSGPRNDRKIAMSIKNYCVPQILEFAYLVLRNTPKNKPQ